MLISKWAIKKINQNPVVLHDIPVTNIGLRPVILKSVGLASMTENDPNIVKINVHLIPVTFEKVISTNDKLLTSLN